MRLFLRYLFLVLFTANLVTAVAWSQIPMPKSWEEPLPSGPMNDDYELGPDSKPQPDVPKGKVFGFPLQDSKIFPGTKRHISVYVPAQYRGDKPACVYVALDGLGFNAPVVFDNLIHKGEIPILIAIGISSGQVAPVEGEENPRFNRSFEFDGLSDALCRFIVEEVFAEVEKRKTPDDLPILLSKNPNDRCTAGGSTGGIGAFTLAWERPDQFRRVFSAIGTFVCMRGGDRYPILVRKTEPKPIRVFMQDGHHDQWMGGPEVGDWWIGNVALNRALQFSGYDVRHAWGTGPHSNKQAAAVFPDAMRWLWRDWPEPVVAATEKSLNVFLKQTLLPGSDWTLVSDKLQKPVDLAVNTKGEIFCRDAATRTIHRLADDGSVTEIAKQPGIGGSIAFDANGHLYSADLETKAIFSADLSKPADTVTWQRRWEDIAATKMASLSNGNLYVTDSQDGNVWLIDADGEKKMVGQNLNHPTGVAAMPDGRWLAVVESGSHFGTSYQIGADGILHHGQRYYWFHVADTADDLGSGDCCFDQDGRFYVATRLGVSILDRNGRTRAILPMPVRGGQAETVALCFGGTNFDTLYVIADGKIFKRTLKVKGASSWKAPAGLPKWGAG